MDLSTLILGGIALYLITDTKAANKKLQSQIDSVTTSFSEYKADQEVKEELQEIEREAAAADADVASKCYPIGFFGIIGNYYTSDKYMSALWYVKFKNVSGDQITVNLESVSVTILNSKQIRHQSDLFRKQITVAPNSVSDWVLVGKYLDDELYGYGTVGQDILNSFKDFRYDFWYRAEATLKYRLSNPYVNNGLSVDVKDVTVDGGVYGVRVFEELNLIYNVAPECGKWEDYHIALDNYYYEKFKQKFGNQTVEEVMEKLAKGEIPMKEYTSLFKLGDKTEPQEPERLGVPKIYYWWNEDGVQKIDAV